MAAFFSRQLIALALYHGHSVGIIAGAVCVAVFNIYIYAADAEKVAGGIQHAAPYEQILYVDACYAVVACFEEAIFNK